MNALYFACAPSDYDEEDGAVLIFKPKNDRVKYFDSDSISCISNLSMLSYAEKQSIIDQIKSDKKKGQSWKQVSENFRETKPADRLLHFIRAEKAHFRNLFEAGHLLQPVAVIPKNTNRRIVAQAGAFIAFGLASYLEMTAHNDLSVQKLVIPSKSKKTLLGKLDILGINQRTLFPEMERSADYIKRKFS